MLLSRPSHNHSLQQRPGSRTSWGLWHLSSGLCRSSVHRGTQVTPPPRQWQSWAQEGWNACPSSSLLPFTSQPSSFRPDHAKWRGKGMSCGWKCQAHYITSVPRLRWLMGDMCRQISCRKCFAIQSLLELLGVCCKFSREWNYWSNGLIPENKKYSHLLYNAVHWKGCR